MNQGFIVLWRKFTGTSFYKDSYAVHLAIHLIIEANHEPKKFLFNGKEETLSRGQLISGRLTLADETGIPPSTVYRKLELFRNIGFLDIKSNSKFSVITICNYSTYQDIKSKDGQHIGQPADSGRTASGQRTDSQRTQTTIQPLNNLTIKPLKTNKVFIAPTLKQVKEYCIEIKTKIDPEVFFHTYESQGWIKQNGRPVLNWKSTIKTWEKRDERTNTNQKHFGTDNDRDKRKKLLDGLG